MSDGPFKDSDFEVTAFSEHGKHAISLSAHHAKCLANARYRELHPPVSEGMRFTAGDFGGLAREYWFPEFLNIANAKLQRILAQGVRVWRTKLMNVRPGWIADSRLWCEVQSENTGEAGIVINIEGVAK